VKRSFLVLIDVFNGLLMCDIKDDTEVDGLFSINVWMLILMSRYDNFARSCEIDGFENVWGS